MFCSGCGSRLEVTRAETKALIGGGGGGGGGGGEEMRKYIWNQCIS